MGFQSCQRSALLKVTYETSENRWASRKSTLPGSLVSVLRPLEVSNQGAGVFLE